MEKPGQIWDPSANADDGSRRGTSRPVGAGVAVGEMTLTRGPLVFPWGTKWKTLQQASRSLRLPPERLVATSSISRTRRTGIPKSRGAITRAVPGVRAPATMTTTGRAVAQAGHPDPPSVDAG